MEQVKVKPRKGVKVGKDTGELFKEIGETVDKTVRISRLIREGDLEVFFSEKKKGGV